MTQSKNSRPATCSFDTSPEDTFLTTKQLAARQRRGEHTIRNDRGKGTYIPFHNIGGVRYRLSEVMAYEKEHRVPCSGCPTASGDLRNETFLTPNELASRHQRAVKSLTNDRYARRYISFYKFEGQIRYALSDVLAYEQAHRMTSTSSVEGRKLNGTDRPSALN